MARARGHLTGHVVLGTVASVQSVAAGPRRTEHRVELVSNQGVLHVRRRAGRTAGIFTLSASRASDAPSTRAASNSSDGSVTRNCRIRKTAKGEAIAGRIRTV